MAVVFRLLRNTYFDSVYLMGLGGRLSKQPGIRRNAVIMATPANHELLVEFGVASADLDGAGATDLALAVDADTSAAGGAALELVDGWLQEGAGEVGVETAATLDGALQLLPDANLAVISVPGEYAAAEARRALEKGLHVFLFSDNVSLEDELALKELGAERGLLVMGPDCGTAIIAGTGVGFANAVRRGSIGIVGPSGTGMQQVSCLIHAAGAGVSHALGTGSHDLADAIGGLTTLQSLDALAEDEETAVIVLVSKPAGPSTRQHVLEWIAASSKPVVTCFLGMLSAEETPPAGPQHIAERTLAGAAAAAVRLVGQEPAPVLDIRIDGFDDSSLHLLTTSAVHKRAPEEPAGLRVAGAGAIRGLFAGGTFCYEAQQILLGHGIVVRSNAPLRKDLLLDDPFHAEGHALIDLGDDTFTRGRPHPMIDATLRNERIVAEASDPTVGLILLDFILGHGAMADPAGEAAPAIREAFRLAEAAGRSLQVLAFVCGTDADAQDRDAQEATLTALGVALLPSSTAAAHAVATAIAGAPPAAVDARARSPFSPDAHVEAKPIEMAPPLVAPTIGAQGVSGEGWARTPAVKQLLSLGPIAIALGVRLFSLALEEQQVRTVHVTWSPPAGGDKAMADLLAELL